MNLLQNILYPKMGGGQNVLSPIIEKNENNESMDNLTLNDLVSDTVTPFNVESKRGSSNPYLTPATPVETPKPIQKNVVVKRGNSNAFLTPSSPLETPKQKPYYSSLKSILNKVVKQEPPKSKSKPETSIHPNIVVRRGNSNSFLTPSTPLESQKIIKAKPKPEVLIIPTKSPPVTPIKKTQPVTPMKMKTSPVTPMKTSTKAKAESPNKPPFKTSYVPTKTGYTPRKKKSTADREYDEI
jgi:hypothetical protein